MKKSVSYIILPVMMLFISLPVYASGEDDVKISDDNNTKCVSFEHDESEFNFSFPFVHDYMGAGRHNNGGHFSRWTVTSGLIGLGWNSTIDQTAGLKQRGSHSIDFFWGHILALRYRTARKGPSVSLGFGIDFRNWVTREGVYGRVAAGSGVVGCEPWPDGAYDGSSRLYAFSMMFPLTIRQSLSHGFTLTAGASLDVTTHASVRSSYRLDDVKYSSSWDGFDHNTIGFSVLGALQWHDIGVFARYTPTSPVKAENGVEFKTLTVGVAVAW
ncbi:MAG: hypothetical protein K2L69_00680 [Muribaculaceae bacterium]|nr:hypothetical protein [Muribaculaceae bacterium]